MVRIIIDRLYEGGLHYIKAAGLADDTKPSGVITGSEYIAVDTGDKYAYDEEGDDWNKTGSVGVSPEEIAAAVDAWLDDHPEATTTVEDGSITKAKLDSNLAGAIDDVSDLKTAIEEINDDLFDYESHTEDVDETTLNADLDWTAGYITNTGDTGGSSSYQHTKQIAVNYGDVVKYITESGTYDLEVRFVAAYNNGSIVSSAGSSSQVTSYTVPAGVTHIVFSVTNNNVIEGAKLHRYYTTTTEVKTFDAGECIREISETVQETTSETIEPTFTMEDGYWWGGVTASTTYKYTILDVNAGDILTCLIRATSLSQQMRFVDAYNGNSRVSTSSAQDVFIYTVPSGINKLYVSVATSSASDIKFQIARSTTTTAIMPKGVHSLDNSVSILTDNGFVITDTKASLTSNTEYVLAGNIDNRMDDNIDLWCNFSEFDSITVGHGKGTYGGYITIDDTNAIVYYNGSAVKTYTHELTFSGFIEVHVRHSKAAEASFIISTAGGTWTSDANAQWHGCKGDIFVGATMDITNIRFSASFRDWKKDVFVFADSYASVGDPDRWPYYINYIYNADNYALFGFGGVGSAAEITCFRNVIAKAKPIWVAWFIGMNDGDSSSAINSTWKTCVDEVIATCNQYGIIPILATIPCTPTVNNTYKNAYVKSSDCAYVDFAKAVNGETANATWYTGMLSSDNVHPTALGAKALAARLVADLPQVI